MRASPLHYIELGSGPPLLLIHGLFDSLETWSKVLPLLSDRFKIVAIDLPAFGKSALPDRWTESVSGMIGAVAAFLDQKGIEKISLVGSSMGGSLALGIGERYPERVDKIVLLNPYGLPSIPAAVAAARNFLLGNLLPYLLIKPFLRRCAKILYRRSLYDQTLLDEILIDRVILPYSSLRRRRDLFRFLKGISPEEIMKIDHLLPAIRRPVLILWGENDRWLSEAHLARLQRRLPQSRVIKLPSCGHLPQMEKPKEVAEAIFSHIPCE
ncbi:MAG TPA: alpha/beta hydrolase [Candidatus Manganitrophaceae bacterium]|nr:alpha/beta hydrolase [Candidatus Manganitrophaceae bacterium]